MGACTEFCAASAVWGIAKGKMTSASDKAATRRQAFGKKVSTEAGGSGSIASKLGGCPAANLHGRRIGSNRMHHHLQIECFLANAEIIIEQGKSNRADRRNQRAANEIADLHQDRPENDEL